MQIYFVEEYVEVVIRNIRNRSNSTRNIRSDVISINSGTSRRRNSSDRNSIRNTASG